LPRVEKNKGYHDNDDEEDYDDDGDDDDEDDEDYDDEDDDDDDDGGDVEDKVSEQRMKSEILLRLYNLDKYEQISDKFVQQMVIVHKDWNLIFLRGSLGTCVTQQESKIKGFLFYGLGFYQVEYLKSDIFKFE